MNDFWRVVAQACRRRFTLTACLATSLLVALFWGCNIGVIYPIVKVVFAGKGASAYLVDEIDTAQREITRLEASVAELRQQIDASDETSEQRKLGLQLDYQLSRIEIEKEGMAWAAYLKPYADAYMPATPFHSLVLIMGLLLAGTVVKLIMLTANLMLVQELTERTAYQVRLDVFRKALRLDLEHFGENGSSDLLSRLTNDVNTLATGLQVLFGRLVREPLKMVVCLAGAAWISWRLLLVVLIISPVLAFSMSYLSRSIRRSSRRVLEEMTQLYGVLGEAFAGIRVVKAYHTFAHERMRFRQTADKYYRKSMKMAFYNAMARPTSELLGMSMLVLAILSGGYLLLNEQTHLLGIPMSDEPLEFGQMITFFAFLIGTTDPARKLTDVWSQLQRGMAAAERIYEIKRQTQRVTHSSMPQRINRPHRTIAFDNLIYRYPSGSQVLNGIDLRIEHGETIAIVGPNGSGKSTLISMLCRFDDPQGGALTVDGVTLKDIPLREWRKRIGLVTQQTVFFEDTILNNIRYGSPRKAKADVIEAAKAAHADEFIRDVMPDGYETLLGAGQIRLSGGQMQRVALARAMLRDPDILILDEATSQIDLESEALIHAALGDFLKRRTGIMITHRPTTLALADRIVVIEEGRVSHVGHHEQLLAQNPFYRSLVGARGDRLSA